MLFGFGLELRASFGLLPEVRFLIAVSF